MKHLGRIISLPVGLVLIAVGIIIFVTVNRAITHEFTRAAIVIPDGGAPDIVDPYKRFVGNEGDENNVRNYRFSVYNLTNPAETMEGELPKYQEVGPYEYNYIYERINPTLTEDDDVLSFKLWKRYTPILTDTNRNPLTDTIYHFNLAYAGALASAGGELAISIALTAGAMNTIIAQFKSQLFITEVSTVATPIVLGLANEALLGKVGGSAAFAYEGWFNGVVSVDPTQTPVVFSIKPFGVSTAVTQAVYENLFNSANPLSLTNPAPTSYLAYASPDKTNVIAGLVAGFGLTPTDAAKIVAYQNTMVKALTPIALTQKVNEACDATCASVENFGVYHWASQFGLLLGKSVYDLKPGAFPGKPEFGLNTGLNLTLDKAQSLFAFTSNVNIVTPAGIVTILQNVAKLQKNETVNTTPFTVSEYLAIAQYTGYIMKVFIDDDLVKNDIFGDYIGGPIVKHTVNNFLFNSTDPLLQRVSPSKASSSPLKNIQTIEQANATLGTDSIHTGKNDLDLVSAPITFDSEEELNYPTKVKVSGAFGEQLPPNYLFKNPNAQVNAFTDEFARSLLFKKEAGATFKGANIWRYRIDPSNWEVNEDYGTEIKYLMNLTPVKGAPVYVTRPRMKGLDAGYFYKAGVTELIDNDEDLDVFADYEPRSGKAINGRYSIQINHYISGADGQLSPLYNKYTKMRADVVHPLFWGASIVAATQEQVDILIMAYQVDSVRYALTVILIVVGGFLSFCSVGLFGLDILERKGYF